MPADDDDDEVVASEKVGISTPDEEADAESTKEAQEETPVVETEKAESEPATKTEESPKEDEPKAEEETAVVEEGNADPVPEPVEETTAEESNPNQRRRLLPKKKRVNHRLLLNEKYHQSQ
jgi:hypothetical protein